MIQTRQVTIVCPSCLGTDIDILNESPQRMFVYCPKCCGYFNLPGLRYKSEVLDKLTVEAPPMSEPEKSETALATALAKTKFIEPEVVTTTQPFVLEVESTDTVGRKHTLSVVIDNDKPVLQWGVLQRAAVAKSDIKNPWSKESLPTIINAIVFAERLGLSFEEGDVFIADGRLGITAKARQKRVLNKGLVKNMEVTTTEGPVIKIPWRTFKDTGVWEGPNYHVKIAVTVVDWDKPLVYETDLVEWFNGSNPNWRTRPRYMLEQNALGHALDRIYPGETSSDEAPPNEVK